MDPTLSPGRLRVATLLGVPVYLHFSWVVVFGLIVWTLATGYFPARDPSLPASSHWARGLLASVLFFVSILLHELGHAVMARRNGVPIRSITLFIFGGVARIDEDPPDARTELKVAAAGPAVSFLLAGLFFLVRGAPGMGAAVQAVSGYLALINLVLAAFNLVPAFPLDGGRLLRAALWRRHGKVAATRLAASAGTLFAFTLMGIAW